MNFIETLEPRIAPATLGTQTMSYTDTDGDQVSVLFSKGTLSASLFTFDTAFADSGGQQLQKINLSGLKAFKGGNIQILVTQNGGDGFVNIGTIDATGIDFGRVIIAGDLSRIEVGDANLSTPALKELNVNSMGKAGLTTQGSDQDALSSIQGNLAKLTVQEDLAAIRLVVSGKIGATVVGRDVVGGDEQNSGSISAASAGTISVAGSLKGGSAVGSGSIFIDGKVSSVTVLSALGGDEQLSGSLVAGNVGKFDATGALQGGAGENSGSLVVENNLGKATVGASMLGGIGDGSGSVQVGKNLGSLSVEGALSGNDGSLSGSVSAGNIGALRLGGLSGGDVASKSGSINSTGAIGSVNINGTVAGGDAISSGSINANKGIGTIAVSGNIESGSGSGSGWIVSGLGIKQLQVTGNVIGTAQSPLEFFALTTIGKVAVTGNLVDTNIVVNVADPAGNGFGSSDDQAINVNRLVSTIGKIIVNGTASSTAAEGQSFGISAERVQAVSIGGVKAALKPGAHNDLAPVSIGSVGSYFVREIPNGSPA